MATDYTIESLVDEVCARFSDDPSAPAVLVSRLPSKEWYMSVARFTEPLGKGKQVVASEKNRSSKMCLSLLWQRWETEKKRTLSPPADYSRKDAMQTVTLAVEQKRARYNSGAASRPWQPVPSKSGRRGEELTGQRREIDVYEEVAKLEARRGKVFDKDGRMVAERLPDDWTDASGQRSREVAEEVSRWKRETDVFAKETRAVMRWVPPSLLNAARTVLWHEPGGDVFVLKNGDGVALPKLTQKEASEITKRLGGLVICAFPCVYEKPGMQTYQATSLSMNGVILSGPAEVSFSVSGKKKKAKEPAPREVSRFGAIELDDEEEP
jgi:hypothetical protein